jgi:hypothetical protein
MADRAVGIIHAPRAVDLKVGRPFGFRLLHNCVECLTRVFVVIDPHVA